VSKVAALVGCWCASLQLSLIYGLSFTWSATPRTGLLVLLAWLLGSWWGAAGRLPGRLRWHWLGPLGLFVIGLHSPPASLAPCLILLISSLWAGSIGGYWLTLIENQLLQGLRWESVGMGFGFLTVGALAFQGITSLTAWCLMITLAVWWKEEKWRLDAG